MLTGSCVCRAIRYEVSIPIAELRACHCRDCRRELTPENTSLRIGTLDDSSGMKITAHIWTKSARPWAYLDPAAKQFPGQPDAPNPPRSA